MTTREEMEAFQAKCEQDEAIVGDAVIAALRPLMEPVPSQANHIDSRVFTHVLMCEAAKVAIAAGDLTKASFVERAAEIFDGMMAERREILAAQRPKLAVVPPQ